MKIKLSVVAIIFMLVASSSEAQHVRVRLNFPAGVQTRAVGRAPLVVLSGLVLSGNGVEAGMFLCPAIGPAPEDMEPYGCPVIGNIAAAVIVGCLDIGDKMPQNFKGYCCYKPTVCVRLLNSSCCQQ